MVLDKKQQAQFLEQVKDYTHVHQFGQLYYIYDSNKLVIIYQDNNNLVTVYDLVNKNFFDCFRSSLTSIARSSSYSTEITIDMCAGELKKARDRFQTSVYSTLQDLTKELKKTSTKVKTNSNSRGSTLGKYELNFKSNFHYFVENPEEEEAIRAQQENDLHRALEHARANFNINVQNDPQF